jgi:hypothetical protein
VPVHRLGLLAGLGLAGCLDVPTAGECALELDLGAIGEPGEEILDAPVPLVLDAERRGRLGIDAPEGLGFRDADGDPVPFEIAEWPDEEDRVVLWLRLGQLAPRTRARIAVITDGSATAPDPIATWEGFTAVWHFHQPVTADPPLLDDATGHGWDLIVGSPLAATREVVGVNGGALDMPMMDAAATKPDDPGPPLDGAFTFEASVRLHAISARSGHAISYEGTAGMSPFQPSTTSGDFLLHTIDDGNFRVQGDDLDDAIAPETWVVLAGTYDPVQQVARLYLDGLAVGQIDVDGVLAPVESTPTFGYQLDGWIDELRISPVARSSSWLALAAATMREVEDPVVNVVCE